MERPEHVPADWALMRAADGCEYWVSPIAQNNPDYFFPCSKAEDETKDEAWHSGDELKED